MKNKKCDVKISLQASTDHVHEHTGISWKHNANIAFIISQLFILVYEIIGFGLSHQNANITFNGRSQFNVSGITSLFNSCNMKHLYLEFIPNDLLTTDCIRLLPLRILAYSPVKPHLLNFCIIQIQHYDSFFVLFF